ncbi:MAG: hypothetical protein JEY94_10740 [Melioribacteraceae bacterium]|nr:hypothetical protein [Melioribacteraceae bacterium]
MKTLLKYSFIISILVLIIISCDELIPVQLVEDTELNNDATSVVIVPEDEAGYDSTGTITDAGDLYTNLITATGTRTTYQKTDVYKNYYDALFFDKNSPLVIENKIIGYFGRILGDVYFNKVKANKTGNKLSFENDFMIKTDSIFGIRHNLVSRIYFNQNEADLPYGSTIEFTLDAYIGSTITYNFPTPEKINGNVTIRKAGKNQNSEIRIRWDGTNNGQIEIAIGSMKDLDSPLRPIYRFSSPDDGVYNIPASLTNAINFDGFDILVVTLIRTVTTELKSLDNLSDNYFMAQSIHNIRINVR